MKEYENLFYDGGRRCGFEFCYRCGGKWSVNHGTCQLWR